MVGVKTDDNGVGKVGEVGEGLSPNEFKVTAAPRSVSLWLMQEGGYEL